MWALLNSLFLTALLVEGHPVSEPRVQLGDTTLIGKCLKPSNVDFFGGSTPSRCVTIIPHLSLSGIPYIEPPLDDLRFSPPKPKYSLSPLQSFDARNYGHPCLQPVIPPRSFFVWDLILLSIELASEYVRGLCHTQRIQAFRC